MTDMCWNGIEKRNVQRVIASWHAQSRSVASAAARGNLRLT